MNKAAGKCLGDIAGRLHLYHFCSKVGVESIFYRMCFKEELKNSKSFFEDNQNRICANADMFTEKSSKETYLKAISFRKTHKLIDRPRFCKEKEYFNSFTKLEPNEVYIDCGAYTGDTVQEFFQQTGGCYKKVVAFEPDSMNFIKLKECLHEKRNCLFFKAGVWSENGKVAFKEGNLAGSKIIEGGGL